MILDQHVDSAQDARRSPRGGRRDGGTGSSRGVLRNGSIDDRRRGQGRDLAAQARGGGLLAIGMKTAGQEDHEGLGLGVDPQAGAGEPGVAEAFRTERARRAGSCSWWRCPSPARAAGRRASSRDRTGPAPPGGSGAGGHRRLPLRPGALPRRRPGRRPWRKDRRGPRRPPAPWPWDRGQPLEALARPACSARWGRSGLPGSRSSPARSMSGRK